MKRREEKPFVSPKRTKSSMTELEWYERNVKALKEELESLSQKQVKTFKQEVTRVLIYLEI